MMGFHVSSLTSASSRPALCGNYSEAGVITNFFFLKNLETGMRRPNILTKCKFQVTRKGGPGDNRKDVTIASDKERTQKLYRSPNCRQITS